MALSNVKKAGGSHAHDWVPGAGVVHQRAVSADARASHRQDFRAEVQRARAERGIVLRDHGAAADRRCSSESIRRADDGGAGKARIEGEPARTISRRVGLPESARVDERRVVHIVRHRAERESRRARQHRRAQGHGCGRPRRICAFRNGQLIRANAQRAERMCERATIHRDGAARPRRRAERASRIPRNSRATE